MFDTPKALPTGALIDGFTADPVLSWVVTYAGPCGDEGCEENHTRIYVIPIIGWLHVLAPEPDGDSFILRPAIMSSGGSVVDYLNVGSVFQFVAVLRNDDNVIPTAKRVYQERFGSERPIIVETAQALAN